MRIILIILVTFLSYVNTAFASNADSLYGLPLSWQDQNGKEFKLKSLSGKPVILTLAYTKCKTACPLTMQRLKKIEKLSGNPNLHVVVVSLDPAHDSSEKMAEYEKQYKVDGSRWHLLTGNEADVRKLAVLLSYSFQKMPQPANKEEAPKEEIVHSNKIVALDRQGVISSELTGLNSDVNEFAAAITNF